MNPSELPSVFGASAIPSAEVKHGLQNHPLESSLPLRTPPFPLFGPRPKGRAESQEVIITRRRRFPAPGRLRFTPYVGGTNGNELFVSPGTISYLTVATENTTDETKGPPGITVIPVFPTINGVAVNAATPPTFDLTGKNDGSVWLKSNRTRCNQKSFVPDEVSEETEELLLFDKNETPGAERGYVFRLICKFDLDTAGGGEKTIQNLDQRIASDVEVWFLCESDDSDGSTDNTSVEFFGSSDSGEHDPSDSDSTDCDWTASAVWWHKRPCYTQGVPYKILWKVRVDIRAIRAKCINWTAYVNMPTGTPQPFIGQTSDGVNVIRSLTDNITVFGAAFLWKNGVPCKNPGILTIRLVGEDLSASDPDHCCKTYVRRINYNWPGWCNNPNCRTTVVTPP